MLNSDFTRPISFERVVRPCQNELVKYACYLCGHLVLDPRICTTELKKGYSKNNQADGALDGIKESLLNAHDFQENNAEDFEGFGQIVNQ